MSVTWVLMVTSHVGVDVDTKIPNGNDWRYQGITITSRLIRMQTTPRLSTTVDRLTLTVLYTIGVYLH